MDKQELIKQAISMRARSYAPYSGFTVGAALLCKSGRVFTGCNIENAAFTPSICAERTAISKAVSEGEREFSAIAVCGGKAGRPAEECVAPCGVCLQVMLEFCQPESFEIIMVKNEGDFISRSLSQLAPSGFSQTSMK